jgi:hypothetical protein
VSDCRPSSGTTPSVSSISLPTTPVIEYPPSGDKPAKKNTSKTLGARFGSHLSDDSGEGDDDGASEKSKKSYEELEDENSLMELQLKEAQDDIRATRTEPAIELPALKVRLIMLEDESNESVMLEQETTALKKELEDAKAD